MAAAVAAGALARVAAWLTAAADAACAWTRLGPIKSGLGARKQQQKCQPGCQQLRPTAASHWSQAAFFRRAVMRMYTGLGS